MILLAASDAVSWTPVGVLILVAPGFAYFVRDLVSTRNRLETALEVSNKEKLEIYKQLTPLSLDVVHLGQKLLDKSEADQREREIVHEVAARLREREKEAE